MSWLDEWLAPGEAKRSGELDDELDRLNREKLERQRITAEEYERRRRGIYEGSGVVRPDDVSKAFEEGFKEAAQARQDQIRGVLTAPINWTLGVLPWWVWVAAAGFVFWWVGGPAWAKGKLAK